MMEVGIPANGSCILIPMLQECAETLRAAVLCRAKNPTKVHLQLDRCQDGGVMCAHGDNAISDIKDAQKKDTVADEMAPRASPMRLKS